MEEYYPPASVHIDLPCLRHELVLHVYQQDDLPNLQLEQFRFEKLPPRSDGALLLCRVLDVFLWPHGVHRILLALPWEVASAQFHQRGLW